MGISTRLRPACWTAYLATQLVGQGRIPFLSAEEIRRRQSKRLRKTVAHAFRHVPYYRDTMRRLNLRPEDIREVEDLNRLPILENDDLRRDPEYFVSGNLNRAESVALLSSGSTGSPKTIWHDAAGIFQNAAHGERERALMTKALGRWSGFREMVIVSPVGASQQEIQDFVRDHALFPRRMRIRRKYIYLTDPPDKNLKLLNEFQPDLLYSYGSYLEMLFDYVNRTNAGWHRPKAILYSSDRLTRPTLTWLTNQCGIPVFTVYGAVEALKIGFGCEAGEGLHANVDLYPIRIIDDSGHDAPSGASGAVLLSNLVNRGTVLLNFRTGDIAAFLPGDCPCGRTLPRITLPLGRVDEVLELPGGAHVHPITVHDICLGHPGIVRYQARQLAPAAFRISLVAAPRADREDARQYVLNRFHQRFGPEVSAEVLFVEQLERTRGGKTPAVISLGHKFSPLQEDKAC